MDDMGKLPAVEKALRAACKEVVDQHGYRLCKNVTVEAGRCCAIGAYSVVHATYVNRREEGSIFKQVAADLGVSSSLMACLADGFDGFKGEHYRFTMKAYFDLGAQLANDYVLPVTA